jgi:dTMP kinase
MIAARDDHARRLIRPTLDSGGWVLCDRFVDSTRVYQGLAAGLGLELVDRLHALLLPDLVPDLTLLLDLDPETGLARRAAGGQATRFDRKGHEFHARVRQGFLELAAREPARFVVLDAAAEAEAVAAGAGGAQATRV